MNGRDDVDELLQAMGDTIRSRRRFLGLNITELAALSGLSRPFVSQVERGRARPSMRSLTSLANALGTTAHGLMALPDEAPVTLIRRDAPHSLGIEHSGGQARGLFRERRSMLPVEYRSGPREFEEYYVHRGEEFMYVVAGAFEMDLEEHGIQKLEPGDTLFYSGGVRHRWRALDEGPFCMLLVQQATD
ncbi:MAG TPA: XRE family transcriptional regulator [Pseudonocardia sp.]|nr:XRE family transcriptional regulator [Pseudonocardia sp.]